MPLNNSRVPPTHELKVLLTQYDAPTTFVDKISHITVEETYVDRNFRSLYYNYFSRKYQSYNRNCKRTLLWDEEGNHLGIVITTSIPNMPIYRLDINPDYIFDDTQPMWLLASKSKAHICGTSIPLVRFPWIAQDGEYACCAHVTIWNVLNFLADKHPIYHNTLISDIIKLSSQTQEQRSSPTVGLLDSQMSTTLLNCNIYPKMYNSCYIDHLEDVHTLDYIDIYLDSGFPIICGIESQDPAFYNKTLNPDQSWSKFSRSNEGHAITIIGHGPYVDKADHPDRNPKLSYKHRDSYAVIDDNCFPYGILKSTSAGFDYRNNDFNTFSSLIIPLPLNISLLAEDILKAINDNVVYEKAEIQQPDETIQYRPFIMSSSGYKECLARQYGPLIKELNNKVTENLFNSLLLHLSLPHFIWVIEYTNEELSAEHTCFGHVILDATSKQPQILHAMSPTEWKMYEGVYLLTASFAYSNAKPYPMLTHNLHKYPKPPDARY